MTLQQAIQLIRQKYLEEQQGEIGGPTAEKYREAREQFPVTMATAQAVWNKEAAKTG